MSSFGEYVRKGKETLGHEAEAASSFQRQQYEARQAQQAREHQRAQLARTVLHETSVVTHALGVARVQPDQLAVLNIYRINKASQARSDMSGYISPGALRRADSKRARLINKNSFGVWDMHSSWSYTESSEPWDTTNHSYFLSPTGQLYFSNNYPKLPRDPTVAEPVMELPEYSYKDESKLEAIRQGLGYLVARYNLVVDL